MMNPNKPEQFWPGRYPEFMRLKAFVERVAGPKASILDLGGVPGRINVFLPEADVTIVNPVYDAGDATTFSADRKWDVTVCQHTLEHMDVALRARVLYRCARYATHGAFVSFPNGVIARTIERAMSELDDLVHPHILLPPVTTGDAAALFASADGEEWERPSGLQVWIGSHWHRRDWLFLYLLRDKQCTPEGNRVFPVLNAMLRGSEDDLFGCGYNAIMEVTL